MVIENMPVYITWLAIYLWMPVAAMWMLRPRLILGHRKTLAVCVLFAFIFTLPWDVFATWKGIWSFPATSVLGIYILNLPLEEYLFISFASLLVATITLYARAYLGKYFVKPSGSGA